MVPSQYLRIVWAYKWVVLGLFLLIAIGGVVTTLMWPKQYTAEAALIVEMRIDPAIGALAPALAAPSYMATQIEVLRSERVASRAVRILGVERSPTAVAQWREATGAKIPLERYFADLLHRGLSVEPARGSNLINLTFTAGDPRFAQAAANAFAQAYMDVSVDLRVAPARQSASFLEEQSKGLRANLEKAQATLSEFQQSKGIVVTDERLDQESARYSALIAQLAVAQSERVDASTRQRNTGGETSPDVLQSSSVQSLKSQLATAQTKLGEASNLYGKNHPTRQQLEVQVAELQRQLSAEIRRVSGGASVTNRGSSQKVAELQTMVNEHKKVVLGLRADKDQIAVYLRDVEAAQRAYDAVGSRLTQISMEGQNNQANTRLLSSAVEPFEPSRPKILVGILGSLLGGLAVGLAAALGLEALDRRVRRPEDLLVTAGVPVIGVLRPAGSSRPVFRKMLMVGHSPGHRPALAMLPGARS
ncbi:MAG: chain length determinant protein EpsF [Caldimonas sp.]